MKRKVLPFVNRASSSLFHFLFFFLGLFFRMFLNFILQFFIFIVTSSHYFLSFRILLQNVLNLFFNWFYFHSDFFTFSFFSDSSLECFEFIFQFIFIVISSHFYMGASLLTLLSPQTITLNHLLQQGFTCT